MAVEIHAHTALYDRDPVVHTAALSSLARYNSPPLTKPIYAAAVDAFSKEDAVLRWRRRAARAGSSSACSPPRLPVPCLPQRASAAGS